MIDCLLAIFASGIQFTVCTWYRRRRGFSRGIQFTVCAWHRPRRGFSRAAFSLLLAHGVVRGGDFRARHSVHCLRMASSEERIFARGIQFTVYAWHRPRRGFSREAFSSLFAHGIVRGGDFARGIQLTVCAWHRPRSGYRRVWTAH